MSIMIKRLSVLTLTPLRVLALQPSLRQQQLMLSQIYKEKEVHEPELMLSQIKEKEVHQMPQIPSQTKPQHH